MTPAPKASITFAAAIALYACLTASVQADAREIVLYDGFGASRFLLEGRVIEADGERPEAESDTWFVNLKRTLGRLVNDEQEKVPLRVTLGKDAWPAVTDEEGYFRLEANTPAGLRAGWHQVAVAAERSPAQATGAVLLVPAENRLGIISDLDDTILVSHVTDKSQLLRNTLLVNYAQRQPVAGTAALYARLARRNPRPEAAPIFYLSASPRQLHAGIQAFLDRNGFPRGVLITKKVTNDETSDPLVDQMRYKTARIEQLLAALPQVKFTLVGDDGERDPEIYDRIRRQYPHRIEAVWIRKVSRDTARAVYPAQRDLAQALSGAAPQTGRAP